MGLHGWENCTVRATDLGVELEIPRIICGPTDFNDSETARNGVGFVVLAKAQRPKFSGSYPETPKPLHKESTSNHTRVPTIRYILQLRGFWSLCVLHGGLKV